MRFLFHGGQRDLLRTVCEHIEGGLNPSVTSSLGLPRREAGMAGTVSGIREDMCGSRAAFSAPAGHGRPGVGQRGFWYGGGPPGIRTQDRRIKSPLLYR